MESTEDYLKRLESYMKMYGALVQVCHEYQIERFTLTVLPTTNFTEKLTMLFCINRPKLQTVKIENFHGLREGWAWLARFLNTLPANQYTAVSLNALLQVSNVEC